MPDSAAPMIGYDVSHYQSPTQDVGADFLIAKATEGRSVKDPAYAEHRQTAKNHGIPFGAYHFLLAGDAAYIKAQAENAFAVVGAQIPLAVDAEGDQGPTNAQVHNFVHQYRLLGGKVKLLYLSHSYWTKLGKPDLTLTSGVSLWNADYGNGNGRYPGNQSDAWDSYGGHSVAILQYSENNNLDRNAFRGNAEQLSKFLHIW